MKMQMFATSEKAKPEQKLGGGQAYDSLSD
jgi:hypothetical protein